MSHPSLETSLGSLDLALVGPYVIVVAITMALGGLCCPCVHTVATYPRTTGWIRTGAQVGFGASFLALPSLLLVAIYAACLVHGFKRAGNLVMLLATAALILNRRPLVRLWTEFVLADSHPPAGPSGVAS